MSTFMSFHAGVYSTVPLACYLALCEPEFGDGATRGQMDYGIVDDSVVRPHFGQYYTTSSNPEASWEEAIIENRQKAGIRVMIISLACSESLTSSLFKFRHPSDTYGTTADLPF